MNTKDRLLGRLRGLRTRGTILAALGGTGAGTGPDPCRGQSAGGAGRGRTRSGADRTRRERIQGHSLRSAAGGRRRSR